MKECEEILTFINCRYIITSPYFNVNQLKDNGRVMIKYCVRLKLCQESLLASL